MYVSTTGTPHNEVADLRDASAGRVQNKQTSVLEMHFHRNGRSDCHDKGGDHRWRGMVHEADNVEADFKHCRRSDPRQ